MEKVIRKHIRNIIKEILEKSLVCPLIKITDEIRNEVLKFNSEEDLLRSGGISIEALDRAAFGFSGDDIKELMPNQLNIKWKDDWENVKWEQKKSGLTPKNYSLKISLEEPIDVVFEKGKFWIEDGHHRYFAAKTLNKPLKVNLEIKQNPIVELSPLSYDDFHRCVYRQVKSESQINEDIFLSEEKSVFAGGSKTYVENQLTFIRPKDLGNGIDLDQDITELMKKIVENNYVVPISITKEGFIVDGEHRYKALMELGVDKIPVYVGEQLGKSGRLKNTYSGLPIRYNELFYKK